MHRYMQSHLNALLPIDRSSFSWILIWFDCTKYNEMNAQVLCAPIFFSAEYGMNTSHSLLTRTHKRILIYLRLWLKIVKNTFQIVLSTNFFNKRCWKNTIRCVTINKQCTELHQISQLHSFLLGASSKFRRIF